MDGRPLLVRIARALTRAKLEAILIGNAAAALQGAPVTTLDFDFMAHIAGVRSFESLRSRCVQVDLDGTPLLVADLKDIFKSKKAAGRPKDVAVLDILSKTIDEIEKAKPPR